MLVVGRAPTEFLPALAGYGDLAVGECFGHEPGRDRVPPDGFLDR